MKHLGWQSKATLAVSAIVIALSVLNCSKGGSAASGGSGASTNYSVGGKLGTISVAAMS